MKNAEVILGWIESGEAGTGHSGAYPQLKELIIHSGQEAF